MSIISVTTFVNGVKAPDVTPDVFYSRSDARDSLSDLDGLVVGPFGEQSGQPYSKVVSEWLDSDPDTYIDVDISLPGSGVVCFDRWEWHRD